jgi:hypothetical protein
MSDYAEHLTQMSIINKQLRTALLNQKIDMANELAMMLLTETRLLLHCVTELKRDMDSRLTSVE